MPNALVMMALHFFGALPSLEADIKAIMDAHWDHDIVKDAVQGIGFAKQIVSDLAGSKAPMLDMLGKPVDGKAEVAEPSPVV